MPDRDHPRKSASPPHCSTTAPPRHQYDVLGTSASLSCLHWRCADLFQHCLRLHHARCARVTDLLSGRDRIARRSCRSWRRSRPPATRPSHDTTAFFAGLTIPTVSGAASGSIVPVRWVPARKRSRSWALRFTPTHSRIPLSRAGRPGLDAHLDSAGAGEDLAQCAVRSAQCAAAALRAAQEGDEAAVAAVAPQQQRPCAPQSART